MRKEFINSIFLYFLLFLVFLTSFDKQKNDCMNPFIRCSHRFDCQDSNKKIHFKFERFVTEQNWDALIIGDPNAAESIQWIEDDGECQDVLNADCIIEQALILHGELSEDQKNTWVEAKGITDFQIFFFRTVLKKYY